MKRIFFALTLILSPISFADDDVAIANFADAESNMSPAVFWTVKAESGVLASASGSAYIGIGGSIPSGPNPAGTEWQKCKSNIIYFHKKADGTVIDDKYVNRMLSVALTAFKTGSKLRVAIDRDESGRCYTSQVFDQGL
ncbi:MAG: hypothetical protein K0U59_09835 [Gammaproteobacteria bacterium]|nr:hypothetical protein [Gammaproteobacteria bacterium]